MCLLRAPISHSAFSRLSHRGVDVRHALSPCHGGSSWTKPFFLRKKNPVPFIGDIFLHCDQKGRSNVAGTRRRGAIVRAARQAHHRSRVDMLRSHRQRSLDTRPSLSLVCRALPCGLAASLVSIPSVSFCPMLPLPFSVPFLCVRAVPSACAS
jgi:hypothetical protein